MLSKGEEETEAVAASEHLQEVRDKDAGLGHRQARRPPVERGTACRTRSGSAYAFKRGRALRTGL